MFKEINASTWAFEQVTAVDALPAMRDLGFDSVEVWGDTRSHFDPLDPASVRELAGALSENGMRADSLHAPFGGGDLDISIPDDSQRKRALETMTSCLRSASELSATAMIVHPGYLMGPGEEPARYRGAVESLQVLCREGEDMGVSVCVENLFTDEEHLVFCCSLPKVLHLIRSIEGPPPGICLDTSHANIMGGLPDEIEICGGTVQRTHISDNFGEHDDHLPPGDGIIGWDGVMTSLKRISFPGPLTLEIAGRGDPRGNLERALSALTGIVERGK